MQGVLPLDQRVAVNGLRALGLSHLRLALSHERRHRPGAAFVARRAARGFFVRAARVLRNGDAT